MIERMDQWASAEIQLFECASMQKERVELSVVRFAPDSERERFEMWKMRH